MQNNQHNMRNTLTPKNLVVEKYDDEKFSPKSLVLGRQNIWSSKSLVDEKFSHRAIKTYGRRKVYSLNVPLPIMR